MKYRIVIPVVAQEEDFKNLLLQVSDPKLLTIVNNFDVESIGAYCKVMKKAGARVVEWPENRGCAASWNVGLKEIEKDKLDFVIICSPSCIWDREDERAFAKKIEESEKLGSGHMYIATGQHVTDTHAFAITKLGLKTLGYFDENFHPVYFEDADFYRRMALAEVYRVFIDGLRKSAPLNGGVKKDDRIWHQYIHSAEKLKEYYIKKWGGMPGRERFSTPFNKPEMTIRDWPEVDRDKLLKPISEERWKQLREEGLV